LSELPAYPPSCCASTTLSPFPARMKSRARIQPKAERTLTFLMAFGGNSMGENLILLSCGAAFITGLVITAASLFG